MFAKSYLVVGIAVCVLFCAAAFAGWKVPNLGIVDGMSGGGRGAIFYSGWRGGK